jgi:hypothetical protein
MRDGRLTVRVDGPGGFRLPSPEARRTHRGLGLPLMASLVDEVSFKRGERSLTVCLSVYLGP